jgi:hypothetical protein
LQESRRAGEYTGAGWTENIEANWTAAAECSGFEKTGEIAAVIDMKVSEQHRVDSFQVEPQLA